MSLPNYATDYKGYEYPTATYLMRHCNGTYDKLYSIADTALRPAPPLSATRVFAVSQFTTDPAGTIYAGGYDARGVPNHNTDWVYQGIPTNALGQVAKH